MRPPDAIAGRVWIAFMIGFLMMDAVCGYPGNRPTFQSESAANGKRVIKPDRRLEGSVRMQPMVTQADPQPCCGPIERHGYEKQFPGKEEESRNGAGMENHQGDGREPI
jgi:hypothetical protein